jgi:hypothetical protein
MLLFFEKNKRLSTFVFMVLPSCKAFTICGSVWTQHDRIGSNNQCGTLQTQWTPWFGVVTTWAVWGLQCWSFRVFSSGPHQSPCAAPQLETGLMVKALIPFDTVVDDPKKLHLLNVRFESV